LPRPIFSPDAPKAIGPYSQAIEATGGRAVYCSGQTPLDPRTGELVSGDIASQTARVMDNLGAVLAAAGVGFENVVKTTVYMVDLGEFTRMNEVYGRYFSASPPARATVQVAALPRGARIEIDCIAVK
jgi:2-iminobutanoate/2-iminopropanoate deaminase